MGFLAGLDCAVPRPHKAAAVVDDPHYCIPQITPGQVDCHGGQFIEGEEEESGQ